MCSSITRTAQPLRGRLVELNPALAAAAARRAEPAALDRIEVVVGDASVPDAYIGALPADLVLVCRVFGNIPNADIRRTIETLPQFCAKDALVIWTRHRQRRDLTPTLRAWFADAGFEEQSFESTAPEPRREARRGYPAQSVGAARWPHDPVPLKPSTRLFSFFR